MASELDRAYDECLRITRSEARNFFYAFRTLPADQRKAIYAVYAFCRVCDDVADGLGTADQKRVQFERIRRMLQDMGGGNTDSAVFLALYDTTTTLNIPIHYFETIIDGVESDLEQTRYATFSELRDYCYKVASVVGLISIEVVGYEDASARGYAVDLGIAMQLTNILRDVREDAQRGRIYIPMEELDLFNYSESELMSGVLNDSFRELMGYQVDRARRHFVESKPLISLLPPRSRACPMVLAEVYSRILDRIETARYDVFQDRIGLSASEKLFVMAKLWATSLILSQKHRGL